MPKYFWVNQGDSFDEARRAECLWAPERDGHGATLNHWETMSDLQPGDVVFTYSDTFLRGYAVVRSEAVNSARPYRSDSPYEVGQGGRLAFCDFATFTSGPLSIKTIIANSTLRTELRSGDNAVLTRKDTVAQKYLCSISQTAAAEVLQLAGLPPPTKSLANKNRKLKPTQALALVNARVGHGQFRDDLREFFEKRCAITGLAVLTLLRASHIRPWCECASDEQKLDPHNGLLLAAGIDAAFDCGLITFDDTGALVVSRRMAATDLAKIGLPADARLNVAHLTQERRAYLTYHRDSVFKAK